MAFPFKGLEGSISGVFVHWAIARHVISAMLETGIRHCGFGVLLAYGFALVHAGARTQIHRQTREPLQDRYVEQGPHGANSLAANI